MKNKVDSVVDKINYAIIICLIGLVPITFLINYFSLYHFHSNFTFKIHQVLTFILPIEVAIYFYKLIKRKIRINIYDLLIYLLVLIGIVSTIFAKDQNLAIWGSKFRYEGLIQISTYYLLFLNSRFIIKKELIVKIVNSLIVVGIAQFIYSLLQVFVRGNYIYVKQEIINYRASGFIGHPNMLGSYTVLVLLLAIGMYFLYNENKRFYLISSVLLYINLILAESTGPFYGFLVALIFMFIVLLKNKKIKLKQILFSIITLIVLLINITFISKVWCESKFYDEFRYDFTIIGDIKDTLSTVGSIVTSDVKSNSSGVTNVETYGSNRIWLWSRSLKLVPKYWLHGTGIDNFTLAFANSLSDDDRTISYLGNSNFDRAHNEYLHLLITQGVFALLFYLILLLLVLIRGLKSKEVLVKVLLFGFVGYAVQAFANISVYNVAPFFFIIMGLLIGQTEIKE